MAVAGYQGPLIPVNDCCWRIPKSYKPGMRVDGLIYADEHLIELIRSDPAPEQVANVAFLPGIQYASLAMPDIHWGYGFPIGGVCATDPESGGVISPGGVGYDINCGVRTDPHQSHVGGCSAALTCLVENLFRVIPTGVGREGRYHFSPSEIRQLMQYGPQILVERGLGHPRDIDFTEARGRLAGAVPDSISDRAIERGLDQCGTLGAGNHFLEVQIVDDVLDEHAAHIMGLSLGNVCVLIHSGSRGLGYQVCDDTLRAWRNVPAKYGIELPDRQLVCAAQSRATKGGTISAMCAAANFAWCNRQLLMWETRSVFEDVFSQSWEVLGMDLVYDVCHNIAKLEDHVIDGQTKRLLVHRKGATRAFPPGHPEIPPQYAEIGQPVLIPGDMGRASWVLVGQPGSMTQTFGSACHGAGRVMSRHAAARDAKGRHIDRELGSHGIVARARSWQGLAEEQPAAYKDVDLVVDVVHKAGLAKKVARLRPIGVIKG